MARHCSTLRSASSILLRFSPSESPLAIGGFHVPGRSTRAQPDGLRPWSTVAFPPPSPLVFCPCFCGRGMLTASCPCRGDRSAPCVSCPRCVGLGVRLVPVCLSTGRLRRLYRLPASSGLEKDALEEESLVLACVSSLSLSAAT